MKIPFVKKLLLPGVLMLMTAVFFPSAANAEIIYGDIGVPVIYTQSSEKGKIELTGGDSVNFKIEHTEKSGFMLSGGIDLKIFEVGAGIISTTEKFKLKFDDSANDDSANSIQQKTMVYEALFGIPFPIFNLNLALGAGDREMEAKLAFADKKITKKVTLVSYGLNLGASIPVAKVFAVRVGIAYRMMNGADINEEYTDMDSTQKLKIGTSSSLTALTVGFGF